MALDLTAGGKLTVDPIVTEKGVAKMAEMVKFAKLGGPAGEHARTDLKESLTTSDAPFAFAHLVNLRNLPQYEETVTDFAPIVEQQTVPDFRPATFYSLTPNFENLELGKDNDGQRIAPRVAEGDTYQYAFGYTQESTTVGVEKRGFKVGWTLEMAVNDPFNLVTRFPQDMLRVGVKTQAYVTHRALVNGVTAASQLEAGTDYVTGDAVEANSPLTAAALRVAFRQLGARRDANDNKITIPNRYYLVVPSGTADDVNYMLGVERGLFAIVDGNMQFRGAGIQGDALGRIAGVIEDEWLDDTSWYLVPAAGTSLRPTLIEVRLAGYTTPEIYVNGFNGVPVAGGASSSPFRAFHFDNDTVDLKYREFINAALFSEDTLVWSTGEGEA